MTHHTIKFKQLKKYFKTPFERVIKALKYIVTACFYHKTYLKLNEGMSLSLSKFDVSGNTLQRGLKGYIYGERGVWRPGDQLFLTFVLNDTHSLVGVCNERHTPFVDWPCFKTPLLVASRVVKNKKNNFIIDKNILNTSFKILWD